MGYFTLDFKKAKGASDARMSDHIERRVIAPNVDSTRTHLNRELVQLPEGVLGKRRFLPPYFVGLQQIN